MPKRRPGGRGGHRDKHRARPVRRIAHESPAVHAFELELTRSVRTAIADSDPLELLALVSMIMSAVDVRRDPMAPAEPSADAITLDSLVATFLEVDRLETTAILHVLHAFVRNEVTRARIGRELAGRRHALPSWIVELDQSRASGTAEIVDVHPDGENVVVGVELSRGFALTALVYVDHNRGTVVKDAFILPDSFAESAVTMTATAADPYLTRRDIDPAEARARITTAIGRGAIVHPPYESDTWPAARPMVEWMVSLLPSGGVGYVRPQWSDDDREALVKRFFGSPYARQLRPADRRDHRDLLMVLIDFSCEYGTGDPLHWSGVVVEMALMDWLPRKVMAPAGFLAKVPQLLHAFIGFAHAETGMPAVRTRHTLATLDHFAADYRQLISEPRSSAQTELLEAIGMGGRPELATPTSVAHDWTGYGRKSVTRVLAEIGGPEVFASLDVEPLPDEPFDWSVVPAGLEPVVAAVLDRCDEACDALFDVEHRTACRRFLALVVAGDVSQLQRGANPATPAGAVCWVIGRANDSFGRDNGPLVRELTDHLGLKSSVSSRAYPLLAAAGIHVVGSDEVRVGRSDLMVSAYRRAVLDRHDRFTRLAAGEPYELVMDPEGQQPLWAL